MMRLKYSAKKLSISIVCCLAMFDVFAADMTQETLHAVIADVGTDVVVEGSLAGFIYDDVRLLCVSDANANRMRIISAITEIDELSAEQIFSALAANFHSALDARYAISDGLIYAAFIHPLSSLSEEQLVDAIRQVATAQKNFGTTYSSGELFFPGDTDL